MKQILIILLLMNTTAQAQPFTLVGKGLGNMQIGDTLDAIRNGLAPISQSPIKNKLLVFSEGQHDYFFVKVNPCEVAAGDSFVVADIYIATSKQRVIEGIFLFVHWKELKTAMALVERVFGQPLLGSTGGTGNEIQRAKKYWHKDGVSVVISIDHSEIVKVSIYSWDGKGLSPSVHVLE